MAMERSSELVFVIAPYIGHITQAVELAKIMINRDERLSIAFLLIKIPSVEFEVNDFIDALPQSATKRLQFLHLPLAKPTPEWSAISRGAFMNHLIAYHKPHIRDTVARRFTTNDASSPRLGGFVVDTQCTSSIIDLADEFGAPSYVFFTSGAAFLSLMLYFQTLQDELNQDITDYLKQSTTTELELVTPCLAKPVPTEVLPVGLADPHTWNTRFLHYARAYRRAKGIIINTFAELEHHSITSFKNLSSCSKERIPTIYPVGPIINHTPHDNGSDTLMTWLDSQPPASVVFVCFGSMGSTGGDQVREIANGLERSLSRFVWVLRQPPPPENKVEFPREYTNFEEVLPEGFLDRTEAVGRVVGWVPQLAVLSHPAIGGFISHCGWNSILESMYCGVPLGTWPLFAEQKLNAFQLVKELGLAVGITTTEEEEANSPKKKDEKIIRGEVIEKGIKKLMMIDGEVRKKVQRMREKSRMIMKEGGSSYNSVGKLIQDVIDSSINLP